MYLGTLGMPGMTAYFGLLDVGAPARARRSSSPAPPARSAGSSARSPSSRAAARSGSPAAPRSARYVVEELGFDAAIDYKSEDVDAALREHCPKGIDVYFDNVGGEILDAALAHLARHARVVDLRRDLPVQRDRARQGPSNYLSLLVNRATMTGFVVSDYLDRYAEALRDMAGWLAEGKLVSREDIATGLENFPDTLLRLFRARTRASSY